MELGTDKIDDAALALLILTLHDSNRVWKCIDWEDAHKERDLRIVGFTLHRRPPSARIPPGP